MWVAILITCGDVFIFLLLESTGIRVIEAVFALIIAVMGGSFLYMVLIFYLYWKKIYFEKKLKFINKYVVAQPDQLSVIKGVFIPWCSNCSSIEVKQLIGIVGSIVMPHNIFFHSSLVLVNFRSFIIIELF